MPRNKRRTADLSALDKEGAAFAEALRQYGRRVEAVTAENLRGVLPGVTSMLDASDEELFAAIEASGGADLPEVPDAELPELEEAKLPELIEGSLPELLPIDFAALAERERRRIERRGRRGRRKGE